MFSLSYEYGNGQFVPDHTAAREEIIVIFAKFAKATDYTLPVTHTVAIYADASGVDNTNKTVVTTVQDGHYDRRQRQPV